MDSGSSITRAKAIFAGLCESEICTFVKLSPPQTSIFTIELNQDYKLTLDTTQNSWCSMSFFFQNDLIAEINVKHLDELVDEIAGFFNPKLGHEIYDSTDVLNFIDEYSFNDSYDPYDADDSYDGEFFEDSSKVHKGDESALFNNFEGCKEFGSVENANINMFGTKQIIV